MTCQATAALRAGKTPWTEIAPPCYREATVVVTVTGPDGEHRINSCEPCAALFDVPKWAPRITPVR